jgi:hypothetical protein
MSNIWIPSFILNLLRKIKGIDVETVGIICDQCKLAIGKDGHGEYYEINSSHYCGLTCYYDKLLVPVKKVVKKKKGKK